MSATRTIWIAAIASVAVVAVLAISAFGMFSMPASGPQTASQGSNSWWTRGNSSNATYPVSFSESGLPNGTFWSVEVRGAGPTWNAQDSYLTIGAFGWGGFRWNGSTNSSIGFQLRNGTYDYSIGSARNGSTLYTVTPAFGNFTVNGTGGSVAVSFASITFYTVTFSESGLPAGTYWSASLRANGTGSPGWNLWGGWSQQPRFLWNVTNTTSLNISAENGGYWFSVGPVWSNGTLYVATPGRGNVSVNGSAVTVSISFAPLTQYTISFVETGLPNGTNWSVGIGGGYGGFGGYGANRSANATINFTRPDGSYAFAISPVWNATGAYVASPQWGSVDVDGANVTVDVSFTFATWNGWNPA